MNSDTDNLTAVVHLNQSELPQGIGLLFVYKENIFRHVFVFDPVVPWMFSYLTVKKTVTVTIISPLNNLINTLIDVLNELVTNNELL